MIRIRTVPTDVPPRPESPGEKHRCRVNGREALFEGDAKIDVPTRSSYDDLFSPTADGKKLVVASNVRVREVTLETLEMRDLLHGPWLVSVKCLADDLVAVLGKAGTHRLERRDPDVAEMRSVKDMPKHLTWFEVQTPGMLFVLDLRARPDKTLAESIPLRATRLDVVMGGRILFASREDGETTIYGVKGRKLAVVGRLDDDVGRVFETGGRVYGEACEILGLEEALAAAKIEEKQYEPVAVEGDFGFEPVSAIPQGDAPRGASALVGAGGWNAAQRVGSFVFALLADAAGYRCALVDESKSKSVLRKIEPPIVGPSFKYDLAFDGTRCVVATKHAIHDVDCKTAEATPVTVGNLFLSATLLGDAIVAIERVGVESTLRIWIRTGESYEETHAIPCGKYDTLFMLHDGDVIGLASELAVVGSGLRTHFFGARKNEIRYLGCALAAFKHGTCVRGTSYVEDSEDRTWKITGLGESLRKALERPAEAIDLRLSGAERMQDVSSHIGDRDDSL
jgi:hypothetical protein